MISTIFTHRSIRKYKDKPVPENVLNEVLVAASKASTTGNMQVYSIVVTTRADIKEKLWEAHFKQDMVKQAPVILTFCADFNRFNRWCTQRNANPGYDNFLSFYTASIDALLAAQNAALEAEAHGLGICYLGTTTYMSQIIVDVLELPEHVVPVTTLVVGYPDESPDITDRLPLKAIVHKEKYQQFSEEDINEIYDKREKSDQTKELLEVNQKETLAHIFTDNRYKKEDNVLFSNKFLEVIKKQGFFNNEK